LHVYVIHYLSRILFKVRSSDLDTLLVRGILSATPHQNLACRCSLIDELPRYAQAVVSCDMSMFSRSNFKDMIERIEQFWCGAVCDYPNWAKLAEYFMLLQPSSGAVERAFSKLIHILSRPGMDKALIDNIESVLMLMCNEENLDFDVEDIYD